MKEKILFLFFCLSLSLGSYANNIDRYYRLIYKAERFLIKKEFISACTFYKKAFRQKISFYADLRNAFKCALLSGNPETVIYFWKKIEPYPEIVEGLKTNNQILDHPANVVKNEILVYSTKSKITWLEKKIDSIKSIDQSARQSCRNNLDKKCIEIFKAIDSANIFYLQQLLLKNPNWEKESGQKILNDVFLIAWHARRWGYVNLDSLMYLYIRQGCIKPIKFAQIISYRSDIDSVNINVLNKQMLLGLSNYYIAINDTILEFKTQGQDSLISVFNSNRRKLYMDDIREEARKYKAILTIPLFKNSMIDMGINDFRLMMPKEELDKMLKEYEKKGILK